jgi:hypothetical protein
MTRTDRGDLSMKRSHTSVVVPQGWATLEAALDSVHTVDTLKMYARRLGIQGPTRKSDIVRAVADSVLGRDLSGSRIERIWERLDETQKLAVAEAVHGNGGLDLSCFKAKYGRTPLWYSGKDGYRDRPTFLGLFLVSGSTGQDRGPTLPMDVAERLREFVPPPPEEELQTLDEPVSWGEDESLRTVETERVAQQELFAVLRLVDMGRVQVSDKTKRPSAKGTAAVFEVLVGGDFYPPEERRHRWESEMGPIRAFAWPLILQVAGLAKAAGTHLDLTGSGRKALVAPAFQTLRFAWDRWLRSTLLDEFNRVDVIKGQSDRKRMTAVADRRAAIQRVLEGCPSGRWIAIDEFSRHMIAIGESFQVTHDPWKLYISEPRYGSLGYAGYHEWSMLQGRYIKALLFEYAATMGLVDIAYSHPEDAPRDFAGQWGTDELRFLSRYDGLSSFRINALGAYLLGMTDGYEPATQQPESGIKILPNLDIVATGGRFEPGDEAFLSAFCPRRSDAVFSLDRETTLAAIEKGHQVGELLSFLERAALDLPDTARAFLEDLAMRTGMLSFGGHAFLFHCADEAVAIRIANDTRTKPLCRLAGPKTIVVSAQSEPAFRRAILELGYPIPPRMAHHG